MMARIIGWPDRLSRWCRCRQDCVADGSGGQTGRFRSDSRTMARPTAAARPRQPPNQNGADAPQRLQSALSPSCGMTLVIWSSEFGTTPGVPELKNSYLVAANLIYNF